MLSLKFLLILTFLQPHKFNNEVFGVSMFVLHGQEDRKEMDKENREVEAKVVERSGLKELEKRLERAAASPRQQTKLSSTLQVTVVHPTLHLFPCSYQF